MTSAAPPKSPTFPPRITYYLPDEAATEMLGRALAMVLQPGTTVHLSGTLGAGKTSLVRGILRALGVKGPIKSPTYSIVELYVISKIDLYHLDFYRFTSENEWEALGLRDWLNDQSIAFIEWPSMAGITLPPPDINIQLEVREAGRIVSLHAETDRGREQLKRLDDDNELGRLV